MVVVDDWVLMFEEAGIPAVEITFDDFAQWSEQNKQQIRMPNQRNIIIPHMGNPSASKAYVPQLVPKLVEALTTPLTDEEQAWGTISSENFPRICVRGTLYECQEYYQGGPDWNALWEKNPPTRLTVGLPVVLPTEEAVKRMLTGTSHKPDEVIGPVPVPFERREFTVETVAINGLMAGCRPEYMPVLLAIAETLVPAAAAGAGGGQRYLGVVSGPIAKELRMTTEKFTGELNHANFSLRHAMTLIGHNALVPQQRMAMFGVGFIAEDTDQSPWTPLAVDAGFKPDESVFSLSGAKDTNEGWMSSAFYRAAPDKMVYLERMVKALQDMTNAQGATIIIYPSIAKDLAAMGMSKEDVRQYVWEHTTETMAQFRDRVWYGLWSSRYRRGEPGARPEILDLPDDAVIHTFAFPEKIQIIVAGMQIEFGYISQARSVPHTDSITLIDKWR